MKNKRYSKDFGKKEKVLNYACQTYQLSRPNKVGTVMALIRECQPTEVSRNNGYSLSDGRGVSIKYRNFSKSILEWEKWYFEKAYTDGKNPVKITKEVLQELGCFYCGAFIC